MHRKNLPVNNFRTHGDPQQESKTGMEDDRGRKRPTQTAYQIWASHSRAELLNSRGLCWDSGRVGKVPVLWEYIMEAKPFAPERGYRTACEDLGRDRERISAGVR